MTEETQWEDVSGDGGVLKSMIKAASSSSDSVVVSFPVVGEEVQINYTGHWHSTHPCSVNQLV